MIAIVGFYFALVLLTQIVYGAVNIRYSLNLNNERNRQTVANYINLSALNIKSDLERIENLSKMVYEESQLILDGKEIDSVRSDQDGRLNTLIDMMFKTNEDISGVYIYSPNGGIISYVNPYGSDYHAISAKADYAELIALKDKGNILERRKGDYLNQYMLSINFYQPDTSVDEDIILVLEKHWADQKKYYDDMRLLSNGSIILINRTGEILMSFRNENAIGDEALVRSGKISDKITGEADMFEIEAYGEKKHIFYDKNVGSDCTLLYVADDSLYEQYMQPGTNIIVLVSGLILLLVNIAIIILLNKRIYRPIVHVEDALHSIVSGDTNFKLEKLQGNELYPVYNDLNSLIVRLRQLINSEYTAGIMKKQAEIDALQSQINPHFLYNTLETIRGQAIVEEVNEIEMMVKALADIFRYSITNKNAMVKFEEELKNIDNYLKIQQLRFDNKFIIIKEIEEDTRHYFVPKLIIQPIVENAIIHGLETKPGKGTIKIKSYLTTDNMIVCVEDDGEGMDIETLEAINESLASGVSLKKSRDIKLGLGLININERIRLIFGSDYGLKIYSIKQVGTRVEMRIPKTSK